MKVFEVEGGQRFLLYDIFIFDRANDSNQIRYTVRATRSSLPHRLWRGGS